MMSHYHELQTSGKYRCPNCHHERDDEKTAVKDEGYE